MKFSEELLSKSMDFLVSIIYLVMAQRVFNRVYLSRGFTMKRRMLFADLIFILYSFKICVESKVMTVVTFLIK